MSLLSLVPYPVRMRKAGYVLVGRRWIPVRVLQMEKYWREKAEREAKAERSAKLRVNWFSLLPQQEVPDYERLIAMSEEEWKQFQREDVETWRTKEQRKQGLWRWDMVNMRRAARERSYYLGAPSGMEGSRAKQLLALREDYYDNPHAYFNEEYDLYIAIEAIEDELRSLSTGRWRFAAVLEQEKEEQTKWQSAAKIQAVFRGWKVRRGSVGSENRNGSEGWKDVLEGCEGV